MPHNISKRRKKKHKKKHHINDVKYNALDSYGFALNNDKYLRNINDWCCGIPQSLLNHCHNRYKFEKASRKYNYIYSKSDRGKYKKLRTWYECCLMKKDCFSIVNDFIWMDTDECYYHRVGFWLTRKGIHEQKNTRRSKLVEDKKLVKMPQFYLEQQYVSEWRFCMKNEHFSHSYGDHWDCMNNKYWDDMARKANVWLINRIAFGNKILQMKKGNETFYESLIQTLKCTPTLQICEKKYIKMKRKKQEKYNQCVHNYAKGKSSMLSCPSKR